jgi:hypothetical protein
MKEAAKAAESVVNLVSIFSLNSLPAQSNIESTAILTSTYNLQ